MPLLLVIHLGRASHFRRAKRIALGLSPVLIAWILFALNQFDPVTYQKLTFWSMRWPVFALMFIVVFVIIWMRSRRSADAAKPEP